MVEKLKKTNFPEVPRFVQMSKNSEKIKQFPRKIIQIVKRINFLWKSKKNVKIYKKLKLKKLKTSR